MKNNHPMPSRPGSDANCNLLGAPPPNSSRGGLPFLILLVMITCSGCSSLGGTGAADFKDISLAFYSQQRTYQALHIENATEFIIRGENLTISMEAPLTPLNIIPRSKPGLETVESIAKFGLGMWALESLGGSALARPAIVNQPDPVIVKPEVISSR